MRILTRSAACPRFAPVEQVPCRYDPLRRSRLITDNSRRYLGQVVDRPTGIALRRRPHHRQKPERYLRRGVVKYYLIANSTFARETRPLPCFRASADLGERASRRIWRCDAARSFARCAFGCGILSGRAVFGARCERRTQRHAGNYMIAVRLWSSRCRERLPAMRAGTPNPRRRIRQGPAVPAGPCHSTTCADVTSP